MNRRQLFNWLAAAAVVPPVVASSGVDLGRLHVTYGGVLPDDMARQIVLELKKLYARGKLSPKIMAAIRRAGAEARAEARLARLS